MQRIKNYKVIMKRLKQNNLQNLVNYSCRSAKYLSALYYTCVHNLKSKLVDINILKQSYTNRFVGTVDLKM